MRSNPRFFAVVPAAGVGARVGAALPKQYLRIGDRTLLEWAVGALLAADWIERVIVVTAPGDSRAEALLDALFNAETHRRTRATRRVLAVDAGGPTRRDSVLGGLDALAESADDDDFILVHDAARPGLSGTALARLREELIDDPVGGLLALPVADTVKQAGALRSVERTVAREGLWLAQTPQMFRFGLLRSALARHREVTDEAAAIEADGAIARLVEGEVRNFKVTTAGDLAMMAAVLGQAPVAGDG